MKDLLFLSHRIPFPPNKGDKIRSYHLLQYLASRYRVHLGTFIDDPADWQHQQALRGLCQGEVKILGLNPLLAKVRSLTGLFTGEALTFPYYRNRVMASWVKHVLADHNIDKIVVYSAALAQFVMGDAAKGTRRIIDFVDVDSEKWFQYAQARSGISRWLFNREGRTLRASEKVIATIFDTSLFVTEAEAAVFKNLAPELVEKIDFWENGVNSDFFSPDRDYPNPYDSAAPVLVFTGAMDYRPNVEAVIWFAHEIFPIIRKGSTQARFAIVGGRPTKAVQQLQSLDGVYIAGNVADVRPYIAHASVVVAPLRMARGVQNKVLEGMAMSKAVLATHPAMEGIRLCPGLERWVADDPETYAAHALTLIQSPLGRDLATQAGRLGRACVLARYDWNANLRRVDKALEG